MAPITTTSTNDLVPMEIDAILRAGEEDEEEYNEESAAEEPEALFSMEPTMTKLKRTKIQRHKTTRSQDSRQKPSAL